jgi:uncharacterized protein YoxC
MPTFNKRSLGNSNSLEDLTKKITNIGTKVSNITKATAEITKALNTILSAFNMEDEQPQQTFRGVKDLKKIKKKK